MITLVWRRPSERLRPFTSIERESRPLPKPIRGLEDENEPNREIISVNLNNLA
jgi:hypothetical protein